MIDETIDGTIDGTIDETIDEVCIYKPCQYNYLWSTSWLFLVTTGYTVYQQKYEFLIFPSGIFLTSLNYWKQPKFNSWERNLDIGYVYYSIGYNLFRSIGAQEANKLYTYFVISSGLLLIFKGDGRFLRVRPLEAHFNCADVGEPPLRFLVRIFLRRCVLAIYIIYL